MRASMAWQVQRMLPPGRELLLGMVRGAQLGPMIVVGLGGIYLEALNDTAIRRFAQLAADAAELGDIDINPLMAGPNGMMAVDAWARLGAET